jgi:positive regulator of sigma E activity
MHAVQAARRAPLANAVAICPRCGFQGQSVSYFSQTGPLAGMMVLAVLTLPFFGAGGIVYYLMRHDHRACARCGEGWGKRGERVAALTPAGVTAQAPVEVDIPEPSVGYAGTLLLAFLAVMMVTIGITEFAPVLAVMGAMAGVGSVLRYNVVRRRRDDRRDAILQALQQPVLRLAAERGGALTVTEVASSLGWTLPRAEKVLNSLEDGLRIVSDVSNEGVIVYEFREMVHAGRSPAPRIAPSAPPSPRAPGLDATLGPDMTMASAHTLHA